MKQKLNLLFVSVSVLNAGQETAKRFLWPIQGLKLKISTLRSEDLSLGNMRPKHHGHRNAPKWVARFCFELVPCFW